MSTTLEDLCKNIYSHFSRSSLRQNEFHQFQEFVEAEPLKLLGISQTWWLSLESCVKRVLEQWNALRLYFLSVVAEKKDPSYTIEGELSLQFWQNRLNARTFDGKLKYANLKKIIGCVMSLPSSNAAVERLFSVLKLVKTDTRNSLKRESLVGLLHTKEGLSSESCHAHDFSKNTEL